MRAMFVICWQLPGSGHFRRHINRIARRLARPGPLQWNGCMVKIGMDMIIRKHIEKPMLCVCVCSVARKVSF